MTQKKYLPPENKTTKAKPAPSKPVAKKAVKKQHLPQKARQNTG